MTARKDETRMDEADADDATAATTVGLRLRLRSKGRGGGAAAHPVDLDFLGPWPFRCEDPDFEGWISLDFLGFSRPNRDLSMGYTGFSLENFSGRVFSKVGRA